MTLSTVQLERALVIFCFAAIFIGMMFRFANLQSKVSTCDETLTAIQVGGYRDRKGSRVYGTYVLAGELVTHAKVASASTVYDTFNQCRLDTPFNPPLYFVLARLWSENFGADVATLRRFSALISLLEVPCFYLLSFELFASAPAAAMITALAMVSPFNLQLAQYARPYSLWVVLTLFSSFLLLRASRLGDRRSWLEYTAASTLNLYTHLSALRVLLSDFIYLCIKKKLEPGFKLGPGIFSIGMALLLFLPWANELNNHLYESWRGLNWFTGNIEINQLPMSWCKQLTEIFFHVDNIFSGLDTMVMPLVLALEAVCLSIFVRSASKNSRIFVLTLLLTAFFTLAGPDIVLGGGRSADARYMMPVVLACECIVGFAVAALICSKNTLKARSGLAVFMVLIGAGILSCQSVIQDRTWWNGWGRGEIAAGIAINQCETPILLGWQKQNGWRHQLVALSPELRPDVVLAFSATEELMPVSQRFSDVFLWEPTAEQIKQLAENGQQFVHLNKGQGPLWKLVRN